MSIPPDVRSLSPGVPPSLWLLLRVWLLVGAQSFGGGAATLYLIRRAVVEEHGWLSEVQFTHDWALCQLAPGINLLGLTILIGRRLAGAPGIAVALLGLLLPSVAITILATAFYARVRDAEVVRAALRGVVPATVGLGVLMALQMARPLLEESRGEGRGSLLLSGTLLVGSVLTATLWQPPIVLILCAAGGIGAAAHGRWRRAAGDRGPR